MKILFISHYEELYGANLSLLNLMLCLRMNFKIEPIVLVNKRGAFTERLNFEKIPFIKFSYYNNMVKQNKKSKQFRKLIKILFKYPTYYFAYLKIRKLGKLEIIHSNSSVIDMGYYLGKWLKVPHVWHIREFGIEDYNLENISSLKEIKNKYNQASKLIAISASIKEKILLLNKNLNIALIPNGIIIPKEYLKKYSMSINLKFCVVGYISNNKNQLEIVKACNILKQRGANSINLTIIGDGEKKYISEIKNYIKDNSLEKIVNFMGYCSNIDTILETMDVGIICSVKEAFGRVTIEYMGNYLPVIGTNSGGTTELIKNGINGYLYESGDINQLADIMEKFIVNPQLIITMGKNAREISMNFTAQRNAELIFKIYKEVLLNYKL